MRALIAVSIVCLLVVPVHAKYGGGSGTADDPYQIHTSQEMNEIGASPEDWDKHFKLMADISLMGYPVNSFNLIGEFVRTDSPQNRPFSGVFDGNGKTIRNLDYICFGCKNVGEVALFRYISGPGAVIKNLGLIAPEIDPGDGNSAGSLVGFLHEGLVINCYAEDVDVKGASSVGGLVGTNGGTIRDCYSTGTVAGENMVGGLVGRNLSWYDDGTISGCYSTANVEGDLQAGGLVGQNRGTIEDCYAMGSVTGGKTAGGLVGGNYGPVARCYSTGAVQGTQVLGGLMGQNSKVLGQCFWDVQTSGRTAMCGAVMEPGQCNDACGKTTAQMQMGETFAAWARQGAWTIDEGNDYPRLLWEERPGEPINAAVAGYGGGEGTEEDPYLIHTAVHLDALGANPDDWDKYFRLADDIDMAGFMYRTAVIAPDRDGRHEHQGTRFTGLFDGDGHAIHNLTILAEGDNRDCLALVGCLDDDGQIKNLGLVDVDIRAGDDETSWDPMYQAALVAYNSGTITNCYSTGLVLGAMWSQYVGGLVGRNCFGRITDCYSTARVVGSTWIGGLLGSNGDSTGNSWHAGGVITNSYAAASVCGGGRVGGLAGASNGSVSNCYSTADVMGVDHVGGLLGRNTGSIKNCYAAGPVIGEKTVGGLAASGAGDYTFCYWDTQATGQNISAGGDGKTRAEMQTARTFLTWASCGNEGLWTLDEGSDYPRLSWEDNAATPLPIARLSDYLEGEGTLEDPYRIYTTEDLEPIALFPCEKDKEFRLMFVDGTGSEDSAYGVSTAEQLDLIGACSYEWDAHFQLTADIDLSGYDGANGRPAIHVIAPDTDPNEEGFQGTPFRGVFDGNGHAISNFKYESTGDSCVGLFGYVSDPNAEIRNVRMVNPQIIAADGDAVGALVGWLQAGIIADCSCEGGTIMGRDSVGGLVGQSPYGSYRRGWSFAGVTGCFSSSSIMGTANVGGLIGANRMGIIMDCYATGHVTGEHSVGGLVGQNGDYDRNDVWQEVVVEGAISNCYSTAVVIGNEQAGGLIGSNVGGHITTCFWDIETSGQAESAGGIGKTTAELQSAATFLAWGCGLVWTIDDGRDYPHLIWENAPGEVITKPEYGGGSGTEDDPYLIYTAEQLNSIGLFPCDLDKWFKLMADVDLAAYTGTAFNIIGAGYMPFTGVFDGDGHAISNFSYSTVGASSVGLFRYVSDPNAAIHNLVLIDPNIDAGTGNSVGALVGDLDSGTLTNCHVAGGRVAGGARVGGLVGSTGGGVYGYNDSRIADCSSTSSVTGGPDVGGLAGYNYGTIMTCYATGSVAGTGCVGGLVGNNLRVLSNCYATGGTTGDEQVGGLVGTNSGVVLNCHSAGAVTGGGLAGESTGTVISSFWDIETSGVTESDGGMGVTTAEMQNAATFLGWGCDPVWTIDEGRDYPRLLWEGAGAALIEGCTLWQGNGVEGDPYLIHTPEELYAIGLLPSSWDKHFRLMADIDLREFAADQINPIGNSLFAFTGAFDGDGHIISNLRLSRTKANRVGLFGHVSDPNAEIKNLGLVDPNVTAGGGSETGTLAGQVLNGTISNCYVSGGHLSAGSTVGGLVGSFGKGTISNCYVTDSRVSGESTVGGLVGSGPSGGAIIACSVEDTHVLAEGEHGALAGGLTAYHNGGAMESCHVVGGSVSGSKCGGLVGSLLSLYSSASGTVSECSSATEVIGRGDWILFDGSTLGGLIASSNGTVTACCSHSSVQVKDVSNPWRLQVGGLVGDNGGLTENCYATGAVSVTHQGFIAIHPKGVGGLTGTNYGTIRNCYATGAVTATIEMGGLAGAVDVYKPEIEQSFWDIETTGLANMCGTQDENAAVCDDSFGRPTAEMQTASTFLEAGWDFVDETANGSEDIWWIDEGQDYPRLWWELANDNFVN